MLIEYFILDESSLASPWASVNTYPMIVFYYCLQTTPIGFVGEEEIAISSEINLENVAVVSFGYYTSIFKSINFRQRHPILQEPFQH